MPGTLYIIPTPIGNLGDIANRSIEVLRKLTVLACEDTRSTKKLLQLLDINYSEKRFFAYHDHNEVISADGIKKVLMEGTDVGLVSDAGTPLISDPGYKLLSILRDSDINIISIPGPSSIIAAVAASGLPTHQFSFLGFVPQKKGRQTFIENLSDIPNTVIMLESTHRISKLLQSMIEFGMKDRQISISKEISKLNERHLRGTVSVVYEIFKNDKNMSKGEFVLVLGKE